jgi:hypothetical protein
MPRYRFVVWNDLGSEADQVGLELPNDDEARDYASQALREIRADEPDADWTGWGVDLLDSSGNVLASIPMTTPALAMRAGSSLHLLPPAVVAAINSVALPYVNTCSIALS